MRALVTSLLIVALFVTTQWCSYANITGPELSLYGGSGATLLSINYSDDDDDEIAGYLPALAPTPALCGAEGADLAPVFMLSAKDRPLEHPVSLYTLHVSLLI